ncbi:hypothetical protein [Tersicoccus sp. Bi-70]|uniref:mechanosensitive ion channel family protein n=1 Tax=Tersicoccus sp. Bi-70 TaxID=1897634 RepID=UPI000975545F|nr:hypothetical protein [Tersicoccus sp. Bi-70]OMH35052.1 hypothetical protein BGP79_01585 [Tersicoccus sp. Bi-70]
MTDSLTNGLSAAWTAIATFVPALLLFLVILIIGWIVAKVLSRAIAKLLDRVGLNRAIERGGIGRALQHSKFDASDILAKLVFYAIMLFTLQLAFSAFGPNPISNILTAIIAFLPAAFVAIIIVIITAAIAAAVKTLIQNTLGGLSYGKALANIAAVFILGFGIIAALNQVGIATTVTTPILITVLATIGGVIVVGVGGGLIKPMQSRWDSYLNKVEDEAPRLRAQADRAPSVEQQAKSAGQKAKSAANQSGNGHGGGAVRDNQHR